MVSAEGSVENLIGIYPRKQKEEWDRWLNNIQDWCISRQLWWGHRIPAYRVVLKDNNSGARSMTRKMMENGLLHDPLKMPKS